MGKVKEKMSKFDEFQKQMAKIICEIDNAAGMASDDSYTQQCLSECGCWDDSYNPVFNIIEYLTQYYKD